MRIRTIKPEFFTHEGLFDAERETQLPIRIAFAGLWCAADKAGRFKWEPRRLGVSILPYDGIDFSRVLHALVTRAFIVKYRVKDEWFGAIPSWSKHQFVNNRETESSLPDVSIADELDASGTREPRVNHASHKEGKGREGKGRESISLAPGAVAQGSEGQFNLNADDPPSPQQSPRVDPLRDLKNALASVDGSNPSQVTPTAWGGINKVLSEIREVTPDVTPAEIHRRATNYAVVMPKDSKITAFALGKNWARCEKHSNGSAQVLCAEAENMRRR